MSDFFLELFGRQRSIYGSTSGIENGIGADAVPLGIVHVEPHERETRRDKIDGAEFEMNRQCVDADPEQDFDG